MSSENQSAESAQSFEREKFRGHTPGPWTTDCVGRIYIGELTDDDGQIAIGKMYAAVDAQAVASLPDLLSALDSASSEIQRLRKALDKIIEMNRQHAADEFGDAEKAEGWACVRVAREALERKP